MIRKGIKNKKIKTNILNSIEFFMISYYYYYYEVFVYVKHPLFYNYYYRITFTV